MKIENIIENIIGTVIAAFIIYIIVLIFNKYRFYVIKYFDYIKIIRMINKWEKKYFLKSNFNTFPGNNINLILKKYNFPNIHDTDINLYNQNTLSIQCRELKTEIKNRFHLWKK